MQQRLIDRIATEGPLPFEVFMDESLYGDGGFFATDRLRSVKAGDFLTSPEVSPLFGEAIGRLAVQERQRIGDPFVVVEVGAGSGSLLRSLAASTQEETPLEVWAVEASPAARAALRDVVPRSRVVGDLAHLPETWRGLTVANELIDNLPMAVAQRVDGAWRERWVGADGGVLTLVDAAPRPEVLDWLDAYAGPVPDGGLVEVQLQAADWLRSVMARMSAGRIVLFDYGDTAENLLPRRQDGTIRTYRSHHLGPHPLDEPGATDITADVNFTALEAVARDAGWDVRVARQDDFLAELGVRQIISELRHEELALAREGKEMERLAVRSRRTEAETLVHPRGLGDFRVLEAVHPRA